MESEDVVECLYCYEEIDTDIEGLFDDVIEDWFCDGQCRDDWYDFEDDDYDDDWDDEDEEEEDD